MRKIFNPTVLILTFSVGVIIVTAWLFVQKIQNQKPKTIPPIANDLVANSNSEDEESYVVYSALIENIYVNKNRKLFVFKEETTGCNPMKVYELFKETENEALKKFTDLSDETLHNFQNRRKHCDLLKSNFDVSIKYVFVNKKEIDYLITQNNNPFWNEFFAKYPNSGSLISFSKVGFNREMTQALVYTEFGCGSLCAQGDFVFLRKKNNTWIVENKMPIWAS